MDFLKSKLRMYLLSLNWILSFYSFIHLIYFEKTSYSCVPFVNCDVSCNWLNLFIVCRWFSNCIFFTLAFIWIDTSWYFSFYFFVWLFPFEFSFLVFYANCNYVFVYACVCVCVDNICSVLFLLIYLFIFMWRWVFVLPFPMQEKCHVNKS